MKSLLTAAISVIAIAGLSFAQGTTQNPGNTQASQGAPAQAVSGTGTPAANRMRIAPGSVIPVQLSKTIDAKKVKPGEEVDAQVTEDLKAENGDIIVPKNTKIVGKVTEAQARNKDQKESQVGIVFDHAVMKSGDQVALPMSIQAIIAPSYLSGGNNGGGNNNASAQPSSEPPSSPNAGGMAPGSNGRAPSMGAPQTGNGPAPGGEDSGANASSTAHQPITGKTQGVLGMQNVNLASASSNAQGSVVTSEKNNVKLEGGTLMLLRVNQ